MTVTLFDDSTRNSLLPLTFTRPVACLRVGILTIAEKWARRLNAGISYLTEPYLQDKFSFSISADNFFINGSVCPDEALIEAVNKLSAGEALKHGNLLIASRCGEADAREFGRSVAGFKTVTYDQGFVQIRFPEDIFQKNEIELNRDFDLLTAGRTSQHLSSSNTVLGDRIFVEEGARAECSIFNTLQGPVYLGKNSEVWEGCMIRGSFALGEGSQVKMGAKIYSRTSIGPNCRVGGEINNSVILGNSSKGHDGYLGNSVLGEWCNLGADTNNSNLKNNYSEVKLWDYSQAGLRGTGMQFCGLIMADHAKAGINTMFNTGTVVGVGANVFGGGYPPKFVPDFSWCEQQSITEYRFDKMIETAARVFERRDKLMTSEEESILRYIFEKTRFYKQEC